MYSIKIQDSTGLWIVIDTNTGKNVSRGALPSIAINLAIEKGMPASLRPTLLDEAAAIQQAVPPPDTEPLPPATENKTSPNNLTREADGDSGENKESQAESNPNPSGNLSNSSVAPDSPKSAQVAAQLAAPDSQKPGKRPQNPSCG